MIDVRNRSVRQLYCLMIKKDPTVISDKKWMAWREEETDNCVMHMAAAFFPDMLSRLLRTNGGRALMDHSNHIGYSPLYFAVGDKKVESIRLLVAAGAHSICNGLLCPLESAFFVEVDSVDKYELGIALLSSAPTKGERIEFLGNHKKFAKKHMGMADYLNDCLKVINTRCARAYQAIGTALYVLKRKIGRDVFQNLLKPLLRHLWEQKRYQACWDIPEHQETESINITMAVEEK